jgi:small subunit ribosomal protein S20
MANIKSQKKRNITNAKRHDRNASVKSELKTRTKRVEATLGTDENADAVKAAAKRIDSAASKGIIHKNAAARKKSRMMKKVNAASA